MQESKGAGEQGRMGVNGQDGQIGVAEIDSIGIPESKLLEEENAQCRGI